MNQNLRRDAEEAVRAAIRAVLPEDAVRRALSGLSFPGRVFLVAAGKAAPRMAKAALGALNVPVADGIVIPVRTGTATITVKTRRGGKVASVKVKVVDPKVPTKVTFTQTGPLPCAVGESIHLSAVITPDTAMDAPLKWTTSNKAVAKVDQTGRVTGVKKGKAQITVASANGKKATITINVTAQ